MGSRPRLREGRLCAGTTNVQGAPYAGTTTWMVGFSYQRVRDWANIWRRSSRVAGRRESGDGFPPPPTRGQALRGNDGGGWDGFPPPPTRGQALRGNDGGGVGWVPACAGTTVVQRSRLRGNDGCAKVPPARERRLCKGPACAGTTVVQRSRLREGRLCAGTTVVMVGFSYQRVRDWANIWWRSSRVAGRGESLVTRCCGRVPATRASRSSGV